MSLRTYRHIKKLAFRQICPRQLISREKPSGDTSRRTPKTSRERYLIFLPYINRRKNQTDFFGETSHSRINKIGLIRRNNLSRRDPFINIIHTFNKIIAFNIDIVGRIKLNRIIERESYTGGIEKRPHIRRCRGNPDFKHLILLKS